MKTLIACIALLSSAACAHMTPEQRQNVYKDMTPVVTVSNVGGSCHLNTECSNGFMCMKRNNAYNGICVNVQTKDTSLADN